MRFRNPHPPNSVYHPIWEIIRNKARLGMEFPAGSTKSKLNILFEALVAGIHESSEPFRPQDLEAALHAALNTVRFSLRKEDDIGAGTEYDPNLDIGLKIPPWARTLGLIPPFTKARAKVRWRQLCRIHHPDRGGSLEKMQAINAALDQAMKEIQE